MKKILGIDIGASKIQYVIFDGKSSFDPENIPTPKNLASFKLTLFGLIELYIRKHKLTGIGIGMAGLADSKKGVMVASPNMKFVKNLPLGKILENKYHLPVKIDNDASCFVRAEYILQNRKKCANMIGVTLGTGVGLGFVVNKKVFRGSNNMGGEGWSIFLEKGKNWEELFQKARDRGDYKKLAEISGKAFSTLVSLFDPDCISLSGSVAQKLYKKFLPRAIATMKKYNLNKNTKVRIYVSKLKNAGALGAALQFKD